MSKLSSFLSPVEVKRNPQYKARRNIRMYDWKSKGLSCVLAWWSDDPIKDAFKEANLALSMLKKYNIYTNRLIVDQDRGLFWLIESKGK